MNSKLIISYIFFLILFLIFSYFFVDPNLTYLKSIYSGFYLTHRVITSLIYFIFIFIFFVYYFFFLKEIKKGRLNLKLLIFLTAFILLFSYPAILSYDIFNYVSTSKVLYFYHENPYIIKPIEFIGDPLNQFTRATNKIALYGPFWLLASALPFILGFGNFLLTLFNFKLLEALSYIGISFLLLRITRNPLKTAVFILNPLVIIESLVSAHNDLFMMFLVLLSFYLMSKNLKIKSFLFLVFSTLVKYSTLFLLPVYSYIFWQNLKKREINWGKIYLVSFISMIIIFLLSPLREEIYPWYAIWFFVFIPVIPNTDFTRILKFLSFGISFGLMLSYFPYMLTGSYFGSTPLIKTLIIFTPLVLSLFLVSNKKLWSKIFFW